MNLIVGTFTRAYWTATALVALMAATFVASLLMEGRGLLEPQTLRLIRAFSEAALIGALADWFAVTALFRRPLGLPIPHTAIIPRNQERVGAALGSFITENFLAPDQLADRTVRLDVAGTVSSWLTAPDNAERVSKYVVSALPVLLDRLGEERLNLFVRSTLSKALERIDLSTCAAELAEVLTSSREHEIVLDEALRYSWRLFEQHKAWVRRKIHDASPWFVPRFVDQRIYEAIVQQTEELFRDVSHTSDHPLRKAFRAFITEMIEKLRNNPELRLRFDAACRRLVGNEQFRNYLESIRVGLIDYLRRETEDSPLRVGITELARSFGENLKTDPELQRYLNGALGEFLRHVATHQRATIGNLIAETVKGWNSDELVNKLEQYVGRDLQFIRINGTLVGGLLGLLLYGVTVWAGK
jgi:uncharacterized membrane-anchored protein YjiN (DUF445 family)